MDRKSFVAMTAKDLLAGGQRTSIDRAIETAVELADSLERAGEAPWRWGTTGTVGGESIAAEDFPFGGPNAPPRHEPEAER